MKKLKSNFLNITLIRPFNNLNQLYLKPFNLSRVTCPPQPLLPLLFQPQRLSHMPFSFLIYLLFQTPSYLLHHALTLLVSTHLSQTLPTFLAPQFPGMWTSRKERWSTSIVPPQQVFFFFFITLHSLQDLSSLTRDQTWVPRSGSMNPNHWDAREFPASHF